MYDFEGSQTPKQRKKHGTAAPPTGSGEVLNDGEFALLCKKLCNDNWTIAAEQLQSLRQQRDNVIAIKELQQQLAAARKRGVEVEDANETLHNIAARRMVEIGELKQELSTLRQSHGELVEALVEIRDNPHCDPAVRARHVLHEAQSLPADNV